MYFYAVQEATLSNRSFKQMQHHLIFERQEPEDGSLLGCCTLLSNRN
jgi:hypothetical protein